MNPRSPIKKTQSTPRSTTKRERGKKALAETGGSDGDVRATPSKKAKKTNGVVKVEIAEVEEDSEDAMV